MTVEEIKTEFAKLSEMLSAWQEGEEIAAIERDLALDKLKTIYDALRFESKLKAVAMEPTTPIAPIITIPDTEDEQTSTQDEEDAEDNEVEVEFLFAEDDEEANEEADEEVDEVVADDTEEEVIEVEKASTKQSQSESSTTLESSEPKVVTETTTATSTHEPVHVHVHVHAPATVTPPSAEPMTISTPTPAIAVEHTATMVEPTAAQEKVAQGTAAQEKATQSESAKDTTESKRSASPLLFAPEEVVRKPRSKHQRMMSIYNEQPSAPEEKVVDISKIFEMDVDLTSSRRESENSKPNVSPFAEPQKKSEEQKVVTLADAIAPAATTLAETIVAPTPLAEEITHGKIRSLTDAIGINDKFLMIRDLFDGDSDAYAEAIAALDEFDSFDDCMIHIVENYAWNPDSEGAKFIMQLLERKLV